MIIKAVNLSAVDAVVHSVMVVVMPISKKKSNDYEMQENKYWHKKGS